VTFANARPAERAVARLSHGLGLRPASSGFRLSCYGASHSQGGSIPRESGSAIRLAS
jgi:hypothetical protein